MQHAHLVEALAEDVIVDYEQKAEVDKKYELNNTCLSFMSENKKKKQQSKKMWVCAGSFFIRMPTEKAEKIINKDQAELKLESQELAASLKAKKAELSKLDPKGQYHDVAFISSLK